MRVIGAEVAGAAVVGGGGAGAEVVGAVVGAAVQRAPAAEQGRHGCWQWQGAVRRGRENSKGCAPKVRTIKPPHPQFHPDPLTFLRV